MDDDDARMVFTRLLDLEPPVPDLAPYVHTAQAATRRRQLVYVSSSALVTAAVIATVVAAPSLLPGGSAGSERRVPGAGVGVTVPTAAPGPRLVPTHAPDSETPAAKAARLTAALKNAYSPPGSQR